AGGGGTRAPAGNAHAVGATRRRPRRSSSTATLAEREARLLLLVLLLREPRLERGDPVFERGDPVVAGLLLLARAIVEVPDHADDRGDLVVEAGDHQAVVAAAGAERQGSGILVASLGEERPQRVGGDAGVDVLQQQRGGHVHAQLRPREHLVG